MLKTWWNDIKRIPYIDTKWLTAWILIYLSFMVLDIIFPGWFGATAIKYVGVFLCVVYVYEKYNSDLMLILALLLTFMADTMLVWTDWVVAGVYIFCFAQFMHLLRLSESKMVHIFSWAALASVLFAFAVIEGLRPIYAIVAIYAFLLCCNLGLAIGRYKAHRDDFRARCALYGFIAFLCCDVCVAAQFLALEGHINMNLLPIVNFLIWAFYYPSQVLIANSSTQKPSRPKPKHLRK